MTIIITFIILSLILLIRYWMMAKLFEYLIRNKNPIDVAPINESAKKQDIKYSVLSSFIFALSGTFILHGPTRIYSNLSDYGYSYYLLSLVIYISVHDTYYYWIHRFFHRRNLFKFHSVHHISRRPTAWTSFAFHPVEASFQALFIPLMTVIVPIHYSALIILLTMMTLFGFTNHLGVEIYPSFLEKKLSLITASHHQKHHQYQGHNFGLYFTIWDKLAGTEKKVLS